LAAGVRYDGISTLDRLQRGKGVGLFAEDGG
jgi:hypothetical protein